MRLSSILGDRVHDADGKVIGRVFDVEVEWSGERLLVSGLLVGRQGLLDRLGYRRAEAGGGPIPWARVREVKDDRVWLKPAVGAGPGPPV